MIVCPLCGYQFEKGVNTACAKCPLNKGCQIVCCPNCGYEMAPESKLVKMIKKYVAKKNRNNVTDLR